MQGNYYNGVIDVNVNDTAVNGYVAKVFGWMFVGLMVTCLSTMGIVFGLTVSDAFAGLIYTLSKMVFIVFIVEVLLVGVVSARVAKMNPATAIAMYLLYAVLNGFTVGLFALFYAGSLETLGLAAGVTSVSFGIMAVYGMVTKADVTRFGNLLKMGLIGVVILSVANLFLGNGPLDTFICVAGLFIFLGLTAYDTKKIKTFYAQTALNSPNGVQDQHGNQILNQEGLASNLAIVGALTLYLDFVNMFLFILRLFNGGRK